MSMDDSIGEFTKNILARAKAREQILRQKDNLSKPGVTPSLIDVDGETKSVTTSPQKNEPKPPSSPSEKENASAGVARKAEESFEDDPAGDGDDDDVSANVDDNDGPRSEEEEESYLEDEDEEMEDCSSVPQREDDDEPESVDEIRPLSAVIQLKGRGSSPPSASPVSRKGRLSVLANTINAWEDDLSSVTTSRMSMAAQPAVGGNNNRSSRFSVSTPPPPTNRLLNKQQQRNSCHQFIRSNSLSPTKRVFGSPSVAISSTHSSPSRSTPGAASSNNASPASPVKASLNSSGIGSILKNSPAVGSPLRNQEERRRSLSPAKTVRIQSPEKPILESEDDQEMEMHQRSPTKAAQTSPNKKTVSPIKLHSLNNEKTDDVIAKEDPLERTLELQGFVKLQAGQLESAAPKVVSSMLKKGIFENPNYSTPSAAPKQHQSKAVPASCPPKATSSSAWARETPSSNNNNSAVNSRSPIKQFNSRKSLQPDPSELSVAQKAKLFERQQKEQQQLRQKELDVAANLRRPYSRPTTSAPVVSKPVHEEPKVESPVKLSGKESPEKKPQYYFGQKDNMDMSTPPPPPPMPPKTPEKPERRQSRSPSPKRTTSSPWKRSYCEEDEDHDNRNDARSGPSTPNLSPSEKIANSVKRIKVVKRDDKMYPSLTDIESTEVEETDMDDDNETNTSSVESSPAGLCNSHNSSMSTSSLGSFIQNKAQNTTMHSELSTTAACRQIDDLIDEALEGQMIDDDTFMEPPVPISSSSPIAKKQPAPQPLMHSVSMYRKNQQQMKKSEEQFSGEFKVPLNPLAEEDDGASDEGKEDLSEKIQNLEQQVLIQQKSIAQASKALNICESSFEFSNSTENVEGERVLLIGTQKRCQLLSHISKMKQGRRDNLPSTSPSKDKFTPSSTTRGTMRIDGIQLYPVKSARLHQDYVYHFIVILKDNEQVYATTTVKTSSNSSLIEFPNEFLIHELDPSFKIQVEVYALRTFKQMDVIPHHMKYHIKTPSTPTSSGSTPSKTSTLSHFLTPTRSSKHHTPKATDLKSTVDKSNSASSNSIRSSNFTLQAVLNLNLSNLNNKTEWEMSMVNNNLILPNITMTIKCTTKNELSFKGFLTVFSDVSGLGAWHRRWAKIDPEYRLLFWTYPDDEAQDRPAVLSLPLSSCITPRIAPTPREICARPNTFLLVTTREPLPTDKDSLVVSVHEKYTAIKHLISADNRMERDSWISVINKALTNMRAWGINNEST